MFFKDFLSRIKERNQKRLIIRELILGLQIDDAQKNLYFESLDILEDSLLDSFYERLQWLIWNIEKTIISIEHKETSEAIQDIKQKEKEDRTKEFGSFNILLDNI